MMGYFAMSSDGVGRKLSVLWFIEDNKRRGFGLEKEKATQRWNSEDRVEQKRQSCTPGHGRSQNFFREGGPRFQKIFKKYANNFLINLVKIL